MAAFRLRCRSRVPIVWKVSRNSLHPRDVEEQLLPNGSLAQSAEIHAQWDFVGHSSKCGTFPAGSCHARKYLWTKKRSGRIVWRFGRLKKRDFLPRPAARRAILRRRSEHRSQCIVYSRSPGAARRGISTRECVALPITGCVCCRHIAGKTQTPSVLASCVPCGWPSQSPHLVLLSAVPRACCECDGPPPPIRRFPQEYKQNLRRAQN